MSTRIPSLTFYTNDTAPSMTLTLNKSDGSGALNLTGASANCLIRLQGSSTLFLTGASTNATISNASGGVVTYSLPSAFTDPGIYTAQIKITFADASIQRSQRFNIVVEEGLA